MKNMDKEVKNSWNMHHGLLCLIKLETVTIHQTHVLEIGWECSIGTWNWFGVFMPWTCHLSLTNCLQTSIIWRWYFLGEPNGQFIPWPEKQNIHRTKAEPTEQRANSHRWSLGTLYKHYKSIWHTHKQLKLKINKTAVLVKGTNPQRAQTHAHPLPSASYCMANLHRRSPDP